MSWYSRRRKAALRAQRRYEKARGWKDWPLEEVYRRFKQDGCRCLESLPQITLPNGHMVSLAPGLSVMTVEMFGRPRERTIGHTCNGCGLTLVENEAMHTCVKCRKLINIGEKCDTCRGAHLTLVP